MALLDFFKNFAWKNPDKLPKTLPIIKFGNKDKYYLDLIHKQLIASGTSPQALAKDISNSEFGEETKKAVLYFQQTHLGPDKDNLSVDGIVGSSTWWALYNSNGEPQKLGLAEKVKKNNGSLIPDGLSAERIKVLNVAVAEYQKGVKEEPLGSNWGKEVSKYLKFCGIGPNPWCLASQMWIINQALGKLPFPRGAHCATFWEQCKKLKIAYSVNSYSPIPGDIFVFVHQNSTGHVGLVASVDNISKCKTFQSYEGNSGDRFALRQRTVHDTDLVGFVNFYGDVNNRPKFQGGLLGDSSFEGIEKTR